MGQPSKMLVHPSIKPPVKEAGVEVATGTNPVGRDANESAQDYRYQNAYEY